MLIHLNRVALSLIWIIYFILMNSFVCDHFALSHSLFFASLNHTRLRRAHTHCKNTQNTAKSVAVLPLKFDFSVLFRFVCCRYLVFVLALKNSSTSPAVCFRHFTLSELLLLHFHFHNFFSECFISVLLPFFRAMRFHTFLAEFWSFRMVYVTLDFFLFCTTPSIWTRCMLCVCVCAFKTESHMRESEPEERI